MGKLLLAALIVYLCTGLIVYFSGQHQKQKIVGDINKKHAQRVADNLAAKQRDEFYDWWKYGPVKPNFYYDGSVKYNKPGGKIFPKGVYWQNANGEFADDFLRRRWKGYIHIKAPEG